MSAREPSRGPTPTPAPTLDESALGRHLEAYGAASQPLNAWIGGTQALALLRAALACGLFDAARTPRTADELAGQAGLDAAVAREFCGALEAHGVFEREGETYRLAPDFAVLGAPDAPLPLAGLLGGVAVKVRALERLGAPGDDYTALPPGDILGLAAGIGQSALSPARGATALGMGRALPEVRAVWEAGGRHLEIGCGVGNNLLSIADGHPRVTAVGVELDAAVAAEARRRAAALGLAGRVEVRHLDAAQLRDAAAFDTAQWSQFFFPAASRAPVLAAARRALKPGGYLILGLLGEEPAEPAARREPGARSDAIHRLLFAHWGIPMHGTAELRAEIAAAGFAVLRALPGPPRGLNLTRGLLLARRPPG